jgi:lysophospholipase L1-like esterase
VKRLITGIALVATALAVPTATQIAAHAGTSLGPGGTDINYYLALGDSLSVGVQPTAAGVDEPTDAGYPNQLFARIQYNYQDLLLEQLGCPGETTTTMLDGGICGYSGDQRTSYTGDTGNQAAAALAFIAAHKGHVPLITLDIGANDLNPCIAKGTISAIAACLPAVLSTISKNLATLLAELRTADPRGEIVGMNYYDPELAYWLTGSAGQTFAADSVELSDDFNATLETVYQQYDVPVADVASAFDTSDITNLATLPNGASVPRDVAEICALTYECAAPPQGPNEHCDPKGYRVIANAFLADLPVAPLL